MIPSEEIFNEVFKACLLVTEKVYDYLETTEEEADRSYPFIFVAENFLSEDVRKDKVDGEVTQTVHLYGLREKRRETMRMASEVVKRVRRLKEAGDFRLSVRSVRPQYFPDNTTSIPLVHVVLEFVIAFS